VKGAVTMARLIDADAMRKEWLEQGENEFVYDTNAVLDSIDAQPTADAVEVVRCRDCKHYQHYGRTSLLIDGKNIKCGWCQRRIRYDEEYRMLPDDFCSCGESRCDNGTK
jgi:hypothetical protein